MVLLGVVFFQCYYLPRNCVGNYFMEILIINVSFCYVSCWNAHTALFDGSAQVWREGTRATPISP